MNESSRLWKMDEEEKIEKGRRRGTRRGGKRGKCWRRIRVRLLAVW
jgi:hypothetical protein